MSTVNIYFVHNSPIQVINALEAKAVYGGEGEKNILLVLLRSQTRSGNQVMKTVDQANWDQVFYIPMSSFIESVSRYYVLRELTENFKINRVFTSMLGSHPIRHFINCAKEKNPLLKVIFFDEGTHSIFAIRELIGTNVYKKEFRYNKIKLFLKQYLLFLKLQEVTIDEIFTTYQIRGEGVPIRHNNYSSLKSQIHQKPLKDQIWFLGQHLYLHELTRLQYLHYFEKILEYYQGQEIIYLPHRYEEEIVLNEIRKIPQVKILELQGCVEVSLLSLDSYPKEICGFTSSALYNIQNIFGDLIKIRAFEIPESELNSSFVLRMRSIYEEYKRLIECVPLKLRKFDS